MENVLLLAMSTLPKDIENDNYYQYQNGEVFAARSQLEPITHMLNDERRKKGEKLDKIIILETEETLKTDDKKKSAVDFYKERVGLFAQEIDYVDILIDENEPAEGIGQAIHIILEDYKKRNGEIRLWIDTQGGFRDVVMVFNAIISLLREQGIEPEGIYSVRYNKENNKENPCPIIDQTQKYDIFKFVSAMQEFMDFGKATGFRKYYGKESSFVQMVDGIADAIQMCQPQKFEEALQAFAEYLKSGRYAEDDPYLQIFVEFMKNDYGILLEEPDNTIEQIRWCVRKEFYQQAITIYIERMPQYYYEKEIITVALNTVKQSGHGKNPYTDAFYTGLFEEMVRDEIDEQFVHILCEVKTIVNTDELEQIVDYLKKSMNEQNLNPTVGKAISKLIDRLRKKFNDSGKNKKNKGSKTTQEYIRNISGADRRGARSELLYGKMKSAGEETYERKIRAIMEAKEKKPELVKIMEYYLAMKLLRNRMNHASEEGIKEDERRAITFLQSEQLDLGINIGGDEMKFDYHKIRKLLTDALECVIP